MPSGVCSLIRARSFAKSAFDQPKKMQDVLAAHKEQQAMQAKEASLMG
jgi:hypothetical protein